MVTRVNFPDLPIVPAESGDTVAAYRSGQIVRVPVVAPEGGTVTSVGVSMPTGFSVANSPITSSGTIAVTFAAGYGLPTTTQMGQWSTAFGWGDHAQAGYALASAVTSALAGKVDTSDSRLTNSREWTASTVSQAEAEAGTATTRRAWTAQRVFQAISAWWAASAAKSKLDGIATGATANDTDANLKNRANHTGTQPASTITGLATVATTGSYNDLTGKPSIPAGTVTSVGLSAPTGFSVSGSPVTGSGTLAIAFASGYSLPTTAKQGQWDTAYGWGNHASAGYALSSSLATVATSGSYGDLSGKPTLGTAASKDAPSSGNATSTQVVLGNDTRLTDARTPTSHTHTAAQVTGLATVATTGSYNDLSNKPAIPAGTVTSVNVSVPTGLQVSGGPVTTSGTLTISYATGYSIPANSKQSQWDAAYGWGNHASAGYALAANVLSLAGGTLTGRLETAPSASGGAGLSLPHGASPSSPANGDIWTTTAGLYARINGVTRTYVHTATYATVTQSEAEAGSATTVRRWTAQRVRQSTAAYAYSKTEVDALISAATSGAWVWQATTTTLPKNTPSKVDFSSPRTLTLPASPSENDYVAILRTAGTTVGSTIARNGQTIMGVAENMTLDVNVPYLRLDYVNSSWRIAS